MPARQWLDDVEERIGLSSTEEPYERVTWRKDVSRVAQRIECSMGFNFTQLTQIESSCVRSLNRGCQHGSGHGQREVNHLVLIIQYVGGQWEHNSVH